MAFIYLHDVWESTYQSMAAGRADLQPADRIRLRTILIVRKAVVDLLNQINSYIIGKHGGDARQICDDHALFDSDVWRSFIWDIIMEHASLLYGESGELHPPEGRLIFMDDYTHNIPRDRPYAVKYYSSDDLRSAWIAGQGKFNWSDNWEIAKGE